MHTGRNVRVGTEREQPCDVERAREGTRLRTVRTDNRDRESSLLADLLCDWITPFFE